jgi:hypothetical protein
LLDRSYSMDLVRERVIDAVNLFLDEQRQAPGAARLTLVQFDTTYDVTHKGIDLAAVPPLTRDDYRPYGSTALYDCFGEMIDRTAAAIALSPDADRPAQVIFVIVSDGIDNRSDGVKPEQLRERIAAFPTWRFLFLGANMDAMLEGKRMGVSGISYDTSEDGLRKAAETASAFVGAAREGDHATADSIANARDVYAPDVTHAVLDFQRRLSAREVAQ